MPPFVLERVAPARGQVRFVAQRPQLPLVELPEGALLTLAVSFTAWPSDYARRWVRVQLAAGAPQPRPDRTEFNQSSVRVVLRADAASEPDTYDESLTIQDVLCTDSAK